jgi:hypothetical protein
VIERKRGHESAPKRGLALRNHRISLAGHRACAVAAFPHRNWCVPKPAASTCASRRTKITAGSGALTPIRSAFSHLCGPPSLGAPPFATPSPPHCITGVHLTPGAHIVWVRGQMHGGSTFRGQKRRGCEGRIRSLCRSPGLQNETRLRRRDGNRTISGTKKGPALQALSL